MWNLCDVSTYFRLNLTNYLISQKYSWAITMETTNKQKCQTLDGIALGVQLFTLTFTIVYIY